MISAAEAKYKVENIIKVGEANARIEKERLTKDAKKKALASFPNVLENIETEIGKSISEKRNSTFIFSGYSEYDNFLYQLIDEELSKLGYKVSKETTKFSDDDSGSPIINIEW